MTQNKTALILGGSRGIGHASAMELAGMGYDIAFTYASNEEAAAETKAKIEALGRRCFFRQASLQNDGVPDSAVEWAVDSLGELDAMVYVAGKTSWHDIVKITAEKIDSIYTLDYRAPLLCTAAAARHMTQRGIKGSIVYITSVHARRAFPYDAVYGGIKAALERSVQSIALELSHYGIRVNAVAPGMTSVRGPDTEENLTREWAKKLPLGRYGKASEIGAAVAFLISDKSSYITGETIRVDGGMILPGMPEDASPEAGYGWSKLR